MRRYLFCPMTEGRGVGQITQLLAVAEQLTLRGQDCAFVTNADQARFLVELGYRCFVAPAPTTGHALVHDFRLGDAARAMGILDPAYYAKALAFEQAAVDEFRPDTLFASVKLTSALTARSRGLPLVSIAAWSDSPRFTSPLYTEDDNEAIPVELAELLALHGFSDVQDIAELAHCRSDRLVAPFSREFDPFLPSEQVSYVGPLLSNGLDMYGSLNAMPADQTNLIVVYVNRGSQAVAHYLDIIGQAARAIPRYKFVVVERDRSVRCELPDNVSVVESAPILRMLSRAMLLVSGGGYNALMAALLTGTPVVGLPGRCAERDFNLRRVAELAAGVMVPGYPAPADQVVAAMEAVLSEPAYHAAAIAAGDQLRRLPGPSGVVEILESL